MWSLQLYLQDRLKGKVHKGSTWPYIGVGFPQFAAIIEIVFVEFIISGIYIISENYNRNKNVFWTSQLIIFIFCFFYKKLKKKRVL